MKAAILGIGTKVPALQISRSESVDAASTICARDDDHRELLATLYRQAGVESRHIVFSREEFRKVVYDEGTMETPFALTGAESQGPTTAERMARYELEALPLALEAGRIALRRSGIAAGNITHLVTISCTGFAAPGVDIGLIKGLDLPVVTERTHVGFMGCHGALNGLRVARGLIAANPGAIVLLCAVELCSIHYAYGWDPKRVVGNALFADGAASLVLGEGDDDEKTWRLIANGACIFPDSERAMAWHVRDHGFDMILSAKVPGLIQAYLRPWLDTWLDQHHLTVNDIESWAIHPGGPRVLLGVQEALELDPAAVEVSKAILESHGNMSSATVLFILDELMKRRAKRPCVALGFGPGLAVEAALFG